MSAVQAEIPTFPSPTDGSRELRPASVRADARNQYDDEGEEDCDAEANDCVKGD